MVYHHTIFDMLKSNDSLVVAIQSTAKYGFHAVAILHSKKIHQSFVIFEDFFHIQSQDPKLSGANVVLTSQGLTSTCCYY
jgi:hypothetical protein